MARARRWLHIIGWCCGIIAVDILVYPVVWIVAPIHGVVIDAATNQPLGATPVAATWQLEFLSNVGVLDALETKSDAAGRFTLGGWRLRWHFALGRVSDHEPALWAFRPGYAPYRATNECCGYLLPRILIRMPDQRVLLDRAPFSDSEYGQQIADWTQSLSSPLAITSGCAWARLSEILRQTQITQDALRSKNVAAGADFSRAVAACTG